MPELVSPDRRPRRVPIEERLFSLVLALVATDRGLTKHEVLSTVTGYADRFSIASERESLERQFERDKEELRDLGVPLETIDSPGYEGDTKQQRYRIPASRYQLPDDVRFTTGEYALLGLAAQVWREGSLSRDSQRALTKLRSLGLSVDEPLIGFAPSVRTRDRAYDPLSTAISRGSQVRFRYLKAGQQQPTERRVTPLALVHHEGRWHLHAHDEGVDAPRTFLLRRIVSDVTVAGAASRAPRTDEAAQVLAELAQIWERTTAVLRARSGSEAEVVLANRAGSTAVEGGLRVHTTDLMVLADEVAGFGADIVVVEPEVLREAVRDRWTRVVTAHG